MAGTFVVAPNAFELVLSRLEDPVPTAQHWLTLNACPDDFDANEFRLIQKY
jgi:hypothetical protein